MGYSVFFLILGMVGRARGIILHLAGQRGRLPDPLREPPGESS